MAEPFSQLGIQFRLAAAILRRRERYDLIPSDFGSEDFDLRREAEALVVEIGKAFSDRIDINRELSDVVVIANSKLGKSGSVKPIGPWRFRIALGKRILYADYLRQEQDPPRRWVSEEETGLMEDELKASNRALSWFQSAALDCKTRFEIAEREAAEAARRIAAMPERINRGRGAIRRSRIFAFISNLFLMAFSAGISKGKS